VAILFLIGRLLLPVLEDEVSVKGIASTDDVLHRSVEGAVVNALAVAGVEFVLELLHLLVLREAKVGRTFLETSQEILEGFVKFLDKVLKFRVRAGLAMTITILVVKLVEALLGRSEA
jgi:hypothetical protein